MTASTQTDLSDREVVATPSGIELAVYRQGNRDNPTVLLVHGFPDDHRVWDGVGEMLARRHHVVTYDVRGTGASDKPRQTADYRLDTLAEDLQTVIDHIDPGPGVHLVGHDWGSIQGWHLITDPRHHGVLSFTSISGPCLDHFPDWLRRRRREGRWRDIAAMWKSPLYIGIFQVPGLASWLCRSGFVDQAVSGAIKLFEQPERLEIPAADPNARANGAAVRMYAANVRDRLRHGNHGGTEVPVQILAPTSDTFVPPISQTDPPPEVWTTRISSVPGGHWAPAYNPNAVAPRIASWVEDHHTQ